MKHSKVTKTSSFLIAILVCYLFLGYALYHSGYGVVGLQSLGNLKFSLLGNSVTINFAGTKGFAFSELIGKMQKQIIEGYVVTLQIVFMTIVASFILGWVIFAIMRIQSKFLLWLKYLLVGMRDFILAVPLLVLIIIFYYFIAPAFKLNDPFWIGVLILSIYSAIYIYQVYEASVNAIPTSQFEAAKMLGMNNFQTYRYIIIPQMLKSSIPPLVGQISNIIKNSALLSYVAISEFTNVINQIRANTFIIFESYIVLALGYLILTLPLIYIAKYIENQLNKGEL